MHQLEIDPFVGKQWHTKNHLHPQARRNTICENSENIRQLDLNFLQCFCVARVANEAKEVLAQCFDRKKEALHCANSWFYGPRLF